jgi:RNA polymerase sigma-70 factor (ECF subfamily)
MDLRASTSIAAAPPVRAAELDEATLARARAGEQAACRALVVRYQRPVFTLLSRVLGPARRGLVPDLAQETFMRVFRGLAGFVGEERARLSTWILTIATRLAIDELRRVRRESAGGLPADAADETTTDAGLELHETARVIVRAVEALPPESRAVLVLRVDDELEYEEIARVVGIELGTVRSRLARARAALREALAWSTRCP